MELDGRDRSDGSELTPVVVRCPQGPLQTPGMFGPMVYTCWNHNYLYIVQTVVTEGITLLWLPTPYKCHLIYYSGCEKVAQNPAMLVIQYV